MLLFQLSVFAATLCACNGSGAPMDADTRAAIDSTAAAQINQARLQLDSLCVAMEKTEMAGLMDSIKKVRMEEIERQLRFVPK